MESSVKKEKGLKRQLEFVISVDEVKNCFLKNYQKLQKKAKMPGFRQGKIPLETLKQVYKAQAYEAVVEDLFQSFYPKALREHKIHPAGDPVLIDLKLQEGKACKFLLEVEVHPEVKVENYLNLELKKENIDIEEKDIAGALETLRNFSADFKDSLNTGPLKKGDFFLVCLKGFLIGNKKRKKMDYPSLLLQAGENLIAPGFDDKLMGLKLGEERDFEFEFPQNHSKAEMAGLNLHIKAKLLAFKDKWIPDLNDELAQRFKSQTLEELKMKIKEDLTKKLKKEAEEKLNNSLIRELIKKNPLEIPEVLIKRQKQKLKENVRKSLEGHKTKEEQDAFLQKEDSVFEKQAKENLHSSYLMEQLIEDLQIKATEEDIKKFLKEAFPQERPEDVEKRLKGNKNWSNVIFNVMRRKVITYLMEKAKIVDGPLH